MKTLDGRLILVAALILVTYLIAHPYIGSMWYVYEDSATGNTDSVTRVDDPYPTYLICAAHANILSHNFSVEWASCRPGYSLMWGW